ncbi:hypothetical protein DSO57_1005173 [Entomophthora muscae]|uniref:Uncharacterized protein n=1 Tax=Entomophthora muscae TaxID=34485 RepID=A0ACC2TVH7_9FUNG|nr:hypothetical protein DSO57_1005173 [Entomophthora muscae]
MPNTTIACLLKWYLVQIMPTSKDLSPIQLSVLACNHISPTNLKRVPNYTQLIKSVSDRRQASNPLAKSAITIVVNCAINAILIWPLNIDSCKDLAGFAFEFGNFLPSLNGSGSISTHSGLLYLSVVDPGMASSQHDPLRHSVFLLSDLCPLSTI